MNNTFKDRLQLLIDIKKINQTALVEAEVGTSAQVSKWLSGGIDSPRRQSLQRISSYFGCNINWLATGDGEPFPGVVQRARIGAAALAKQGVPIRQALAEQGAGYDVQPPREDHDRKESFNEDAAVEQTLYVLRSNTVYRGALLSNIRAFHQGVKREEEMAGVDDRIAEMQNTMDMMMQMLESLGAVVPSKKRDTGSGR